MFRARGGTQYKSGYRDVPANMGSKIRPPGTSMSPFFFSKNWYFDGSIFQNFLKFAPKWRKFGTLVLWLVNFSKFSEICAKMAQISAKNFDFWYMDGSLFLQNGYMDGWHFKNPSGTPLPRPKLSTPPPGVQSWIFRTPVSNTSTFLMTGYVGFILRSTIVATASGSTVMRVLCSYCMRSSFSAFCLSTIARGGLLKYDLGRDVPLRLEK